MGVYAARRSAVRCEGGGRRRGASAAVALEAGADADDGLERMVIRVSG